MQLLHYLLDPSGFPTITRYGRSWETWLIVIFVVSKLFTACAHAGLLYAFVRTLRAVGGGRVSKQGAAVHAPRVIRFYVVSTSLSLAVGMLQVAVFWYPAYRLVGPFALAESAALLAASLKTNWAYRQCVLPASKRGGG